MVCTVGRWMMVMIREVDNNIRSSLKHYKSKAAGNVFKKWLRRGREGKGWLAHDSDSSLSSLKQHLESKHMT
eukprot:scaffold2104_cov177-Ochromonas_danica.AAC.2